MAKRTLTILIDDMDGSEIPQGKGETVTFGLDGQTYEIDLSSKNASALRKALAPYVDAGSKVTASRKRSKTTGPKPAEIRAWAKEQGMDVPDRGRIPQEIYDAWESK